MGSSGSSGASKLGSSSGSFVLNGQTLSTSKLGKNGYTTSVNLDPNLKSALDTSNAGTNTAVGLIGSNMGATDAERAAYAQELYNPVAANINSSYDKQGSEAVQRFNSQGGLNSVGFNRYQLGTVEKNRSAALSNAFDNANVSAYDLASKKLAPIIQALSAYQGTGQNIINQALGYAGQSTAGQAASQNYNQQAAALTTPSYFQSLFTPAGTGQFVGTAARAFVGA